MKVAYVGDHLTTNAVGVQILDLLSPMLANSEENRSRDAWKSISMM